MTRRKKFTFESTGEITFWVDFCRRYAHGATRQENDSEVIRRLIVEHRRMSKRGENMLPNTVASDPYRKPTFLERLDWRKW